MTTGPDLDIDAVAEILGLKIEPSWREAVKSNLNVTIAHARKVDAFPLGDEIEQAPVFDAFAGTDAS